MLQSLCSRKISISRAPQSSWRGFLVRSVLASLWEMWRRLPNAETTVFTTPHEGAQAWDNQQAYRVERSRDKAWHWSASRPHAICDGEPGVARSIPKVIAVYAAIAKELGQPLYFPGSAANFHALYQCVDATLLAQAIQWMSTAPACANQAFNVTNGDFIRWENLWPQFADFFGMPVGPVKTVRLAEAMADKSPVWERLVTECRLIPTPYAQTALWSYGDFVFTPAYDIMSDTLKLRQSGFAHCLDTGKMFIDLFRHYREARVIP